MSELDGYEINFPTAEKALREIEGVIEALHAQAKAIDGVRDDMLNDSNWKCPNKTAWSNMFDDYRNKIDGLLSNAEEHRTTFAEIVAKYASIEQ